MPRIFISYRRDDSPAPAGRLYQELQSHFGDHTIWRDVDSMKPGVDFLKRIDSELASAAALVAVIGESCLDIRDSSGRRRLDAPDDYVRRELAAALTAGTPVIPVLIGSARMPTPKELPEDLEELAHKNAVELVDRWWRWGMLELFEALEGIVGPPKPDSLPKPQAKAEPRDDVEAERVQFRHKQALEQFFLERGVRAYLYEKQIERLQRERGGEPILEVVEADPTDTTSNVTGLLAATPARRS